MLFLNVEYARWQLQAAATGRQADEFNSFRKYAPAPPPLTTGLRAAVGFAATREPPHPDPSAPTATTRRPSRRLARLRRCWPGWAVAARRPAWLKRPA